MHRRSVSETLSCHTNVSVLYSGKFSWSEFPTIVHKISCVLQCSLGVAYTLQFLNSSNFLPQ